MADGGRPGNEPPTLESKPLHRLWPAPPSDRLFCHNIWFKGHNNPRYAQLLPRLTRLDPYLLTCSDRRVLRGVQFRALRALRRPRHELVFRAAARSYRYVFCNDVEQTPYIRGRAVVDVDDPRFSPAETELLSQPSVAAVVVTTDSAGRRYESMGLTKPWYVIPQGVDLSGLDANRVRDIADGKRGELVIGYLAAWLLTAGDRDGSNPLYNIDHLIELWDEIHADLPAARLWLIGQPSPRVEQRLRGRADITLFGRLPQADALAHTANFDIALYPRRVSHVPFAVKIAEYLGLGVPTVAYDLELAKVLADAGGGVLATDPRGFVEAVTSLARDEEARRAMSARASAAGAAFDWPRLAERYQRDILDEVLPPDAGRLAG